MGLYQCIFVVGFMHSIGIIQGYAYNMELMPLKYRNAVSTSIGIFDKCILLLTTLFLKYNATHWTYITMPGLICASLATIMSAMLVDSPQYFHDKGDYEKSKECFQKLAKWNGVPDFETHHFRFKNELSEQERINLNYLTMTMRADENGGAIELED